jgi:hypothetical protein
MRTWSRARPALEVLDIDEYDALDMVYHELSTVSDGTPAEFRMLVLGHP